MRNREKKILDEINKEEKNVPLWREILGTGLYLLFVLLMTYLILTYVGQRTVVSGSSMETTLQDGDSLIVDKISYRFTDPKRFDIVVFPPMYEEDTHYIKRIIGLPGETVRIDLDGNIYINDELQEESYGNEVIEDPGRAYEPVSLGKDEYFVMGDNRNHSMDSRSELVGNVSRKDLVGRAWVRIYPFSTAGWLKHGDKS